MRLCFVCIVDVYTCIYVGVGLNVLSPRESWREMKVIALKMCII